jgi:Chemotaxis protein histidine kinase and related kinases
MSSEFSPELRKELLDDFYAECDELLTAIRAQLAAADEALAAGRGTGGVIEGLFRQVHSVKGNAAIAGVRLAEQLAHRMEDLLRAVSKEQVALTRERLTLLMDAAQGLERIIGAHRAGQVVSEDGALLEALQVAAREGEQKETVASAQESAGAKGGEGVRGEIWRFVFSPSPELDARGVNVTSVRARLAELGEIASSAPVVRPNGAIAFVFTVAVRSAPAEGEIDAWLGDGVQVEPVKARERKSTAVEAGAERGEMLPLTPSHMVRVDLARLDELMRITGEMVIQRSRLADRIQQQFGGDERLKEIDVGLARSLREMRKAIARVRLVPVSEVFNRIPFVIRDLAAGSDKKVRVVLEGPQTEIDKFLAERLKEPLLHLIRNAFSHGVEPVARREAAGKPAEATLTLRATSRGEAVVIQVRDDGGGIDAAAVVARAKAVGVSVPATVDATGLLAILCSPGFSTRDEADRAAGRGVGMAVVANTVRELGGTLSLETTLGAGTEFTLRLPLTLSIVDAIIVTVGGETCAVPQSAVEEIVQIPASERRAIRGTEVVPYRGGLLPFRWLAKVFRMEAKEREWLTLLVLSSERGAAGLVVDRVLTRREVVVRPLEDPLVRVEGISGATELGDGRPILILDPIALTSGVVRPPATAAEPVSS